MSIFNELDSAVDNTLDELKGLAEKIDRVIDGLYEIEEGYEFEDIKKVVSVAQSDLKEIMSEIY